jgi:hypothetical protein
MEYNLWKKSIKMLNIQNKEKEDSLIRIMNNKYYAHPSFYEISNPEIIKSFRMMKGYRDIYIFFDIEFQSFEILSNDKYLNSIKDYLYLGEKNNNNESTSWIPREFGALIFIIVRDRLYYLGHIFNNFVPLFKMKSPISIKSSRLLISTYSSVSSKTKDKMIELEKDFDITIDLGKYNDINKIKSKLRDIVSDPLSKLIGRGRARKIIDFIEKNTNGPFGNKFDERLWNEIVKKVNKLNRSISKVMFAAFYNRLDKNRKKILIKQVKMYYGDDLVKKRILTIKNQHNFLRDLINLSDHACFIVKGNKDIEALANVSIIMKIMNTDRLDRESAIYDIETFNGFSKMKFGSAKLESTFDGLKEFKEFNRNKTEMMTIWDIVYDVFTSKPELGKYSKDMLAHNPLYDAYMTFIVSVTINILLNKSTNKINANNLNHYDNEYRKNKIKYNQLKSK